MKVLRTTILLFVGSVCTIPAGPSEETPISLKAAKDQGRNTSRFLKETAEVATAADDAPKANLTYFQESVEPILNRSCLPCNGPEKSEGRLRIDQVNPDLLTGPDVERWSEVYNALSKSEMPPEDAPDYALADVHQVNTSNLHLDAEPKEASLYFKTMYELIYLAFLSDSTRVATFQLGRENGEGPHDLLSLAVGLNGAHGLTHEVKRPYGWKNLGTYNRYQAEEFGRFEQRLKETPEPTGQGNMLDDKLAMHGSASSSFHLSRNYPIISAGGKNLGFTNGRYLNFG